MHAPVIVVVVLAQIALHGDAPDHGQPQAMTLAAGHPRFEDPADLGGIEPGPVVQHINHDCPALDARVDPHARPRVPNVSTSEFSEVREAQ